MARTTSYDVVITGGGIMGSSTAYHLVKMNPHLKVAVVERDGGPTEDADFLRRSYYTATIGGKRYAEEKGLDYLGALPLALSIREQADSGRPSVVADPDGQAATNYKAIARQVAIKVAARAKDFSAKFPSITISRDT